MIHSASNRDEPSATMATPAPPAAFAPLTNTRGEQLWTMVDLRDAIDRFEVMLRAGGKRHATIAAYVTQSERFLNWLEGTYQPRAKRLNGPYGYRVSDETVSKYDPLRDHLKKHPGNAVHMTFRQIEHVLSRKLPGSARQYAHWWANDRTGNHVQANAWLAAKRKVVQLDLMECRVVFIKAERNLAPNSARLFD